MRLGKLDNDDLERLVLAKFTRTRPESHTTPQIGLDCATLDLSGDLAVLSCDPITSAGVSNLGRLTVHVSCNDAAAAGADPVGLLVTLLVPPDASFSDIGRIADDLAAGAREAGVDILGGHTEVTDCVTRCVTSAAVVARMPKTRSLPGMRPGDALVMSKWAGLEGTAIIAADYAARITALPEQTCRDARAFIGLLSVVPESRIAVGNGARAMHDVTEGGILGAAWEMARLYGCGVELDADAIPVRPETRAICELLGLDALRLICSGSMLIACEDGQKLVRALAEAGIHAAVIGRACQDGCRFTDGTAIDAPGPDEIYRLF